MFNTPKYIINCHDKDIGDWVKVTWVHTDEALLFVADSYRIGRICIFERKQRGRYAERFIWSHIENKWKFVSEHTPGCIVMYTIEDGQAYVDELIKEKEKHQEVVSNAFEELLAKFKEYNKIEK